MTNTAEHSKTKGRPQADRSHYLFDYENNRLIDHIRQSNGVPLAIAIVQLYLTQKPNHLKWYKFQTGIICFVKDYAKQSYFFRLYNINSIQLWEQELYTPFGYNKLTPNFHYFAADESNVGLNFAHDDEASKFYFCVAKKIEAKANRSETKQPKAAAMSSAPTTAQPAKVFQTQPLPSQPVSLNVPSSSDTSSSNTSSKPDKSSSGGFFGTLKGKKQPKKVISKTAISNPTAFRHVQHVGLTQNKGNFEFMNDNDETTDEMRKILSELNLTNMPMNKKTQDFVYSFINEHGGIEKFNKEMTRQKQSAPNLPNPQRVAPTVQPMEVPAIPPPIPPNPNRFQKPVPSPPPPPPPNKPAFANTPPPPPPPPIPPPLPPMMDQGRNQAPTPPTQKHKAPVINNNTQSAPAPPPPPPPPLPSYNTNAPAPPPAPPAPPPPPASIFSTNPPAQFQPTSLPKPPVAAAAVPSTTALLDSIRNFQGFNDRPTSPNLPNKRNSEVIQQPQEMSVLDQLRNALLDRQQFLKDSTDEESESDAEWKDD